MTYPRSHLVDPAGGIYHVCSRCVRKAFLCGIQSGHDFDHRRQWIEDRLIFLSGIFAVDILAYAVMSNHYHIVLDVKTAVPLAWSDEEVVNKWIALNPRAKDNHETIKIRAKSLLADKNYLTELRERFGSLSWFMRYLNEPLARLANKEDNCTGRFWEGRFKSQRLLDAQAILACMVYVDLNPVRAAMASKASESQHTSLSRRLIETADKHAPLTVINKHDPNLPFELSLNDYISLVNWTAEAHALKESGVTFDFPDPYLWLKNAFPGPGCWQRARGSIQSIKTYAMTLGQRWIRTQKPYFFP